ncbi:MAG: hypothetical protein CME70_00405 [Halobacteriovorax sp.]|nr:hypothetical protein [Halobacteriovorax sp.]
MLSVAMVNLAFASKSPSADRAGIAKYKRQCQEVKKYVIKSRFKLDCYNNYHHYNANAWKSYSKASAKKSGTVKIASYNMLHPGSQRSIFKDLKLLAKVINKWDVLVGLELLPIVGRDLENNKRVLKYLGSSKGKSAASLYRAPGYVNILNELRKLDKSWALILSPRGDAAKSGQVDEHVGFFYRAKKVKPIINEHCNEYKTSGSGTAFACFPNFRKAFMGRETTHVFSRRPFLASFESGNFTFSLLGSHTIFGSPKDKATMRKILKSAFNVSTYTNLGTGVTKETYARFAEAAVTLEFMENLRYYYKEQDIIFAADFNLTPKVKFWNEILENFPGGKLYQNEASTVTLLRSDKGRLTKGLSSSYDHFVLDPSETKECIGKSGKARVGRFNTYTGNTWKYIESNYIIRKKNTMSQSSTAKTKKTKRISEFKRYLKSLKTIKNGKIQWDDYQYEARVKAYESRLFSSQLKNATYYKVQQELLSDHMPITIYCSTK